jgi:peptidoglycan/xylan/chitin deacetylase (PgdA/CDA1 family)
MSLRERLTRPPLVLLYHSLGDPLERRQDSANLMLDVGRFRDQLGKLRARGYEFLKLTDWVARIADGHGPEGCCALTFDDGSSDMHSILPALLDEFDATATIFVCPGLLGKPHFAITEDANVRLVTEQELRELAANERIELGSHTNEHTCMDDTTDEEAYALLYDSRVALEELIGKPVTSFAYPRCGYSPACPAAAERAGYAVAATCSPAGGLLPYELSRESITALDGSFAFALKSRMLWEPLYASWPGRTASRMLRGRRHPGQPPAT